MTPTRSLATPRRERHHPYATPETPSSRRRLTGLLTPASSPLSDRHTRSRTDAARRFAAQGGSPFQTTRQRREAEVAKFKADFLTKSVPMTPQEVEALEPYFRISDASSSDSENQPETPKIYTAAHWKVVSNDLTDETLFQCMKYINELFADSDLAMKTTAGPRFVVPELGIIAPRHYHALKFHIRRGTITAKGVEDASQYFETLCPEAQVLCRTVAHEEIREEAAAENEGF
ncbi:hypothetical protein CPLU01_09842 [Colletotrichum plurivorum]|uniref:Uncharacterized protein n=1 Tax=Colletotrichum plurivorum TaxID=2175906 RepID=A0A8H6K7W0_9PEZI|nr:hypothetical protein CPLU01_09842 [Colletotrichum plurivorum]